MSKRRIFDNRRDTVSVELTPKDKSAHTGTRRGARRGFTLIEVMVALAIFVIGALAIVRIFPSALGVIQGSETRSIAMGRSRGYLARATAQPGLVPDAIYEVNNVDSDTTNDLIAAPSGTTSRNAALPGSLDEGAIQNSALGRFKRIIGEKHGVLTDTATTQKFVLSQFSHTATTAPTNDVKIYVEDRVSGVIVDEEGDLNFTDAALVTDGRVFNDVDYKNHKADAAGVRTNIDPPPNREKAPAEWRGKNTTYYVSYRYAIDADSDDLVDTGERIHAVVDEPMVLPEAVTGDPPNSSIRVLAGRTTTPEHTIVPGEVSVRVKRLLRTNTSTDNGSAYVNTSDPLPDREANSIRGFVAITDTSSTTDEIPLDLREIAAGGTGAGSSLVYNEVSLDYTVRDWRWLVDDDTPERDSTNPNSGTIRTAIGYYDSTTLGNLQSPNTLDLTNQVRPVFGLITATKSDGSVELYNGGYWEQGGSLSNPITIDIAKEDRKNGVIRYTINPPRVSVATDARRARTSYWTFDGWAQQVSVAARSYVPFYLNTAFSVARPVNEREPGREYYWVGHQSATASAAARGTLYFPPSEAGKSVLVRFESYDSGTNQYYTRSLIMNIDDELVASPIAGFGNGPAGGLQAARAEFVDPAIKPGPGNYDVRAILSVQGLTVQSRTAWIDNGRYSQTDAVGYRSLENS